MTNPKFVFLVIAAIAVSAHGAFAQQAPDTPPASSPPAPGAAATGASNEADEAAALIAKANAVAAANANARNASTAKRRLTKIEASAEARKKAQEFGFHAEIYNGDTLFCKEDAALGTRLKSKRCMSAYEFEDYSTQLKIVRDMLESRSMCYGPKIMTNVCGGLP